MPIENLTEIVCIVDRSGSMASIRGDAEGGFNTFIDDQKAEPGDATVTLVQFDTDYETVWESKPIKECPKFELKPRGRTALLDVLGRTINDVGKRLDAVPEENRPGKVVFVVVTDGMENASSEFTRTQIAEMIKRQTEEYNWQFVFLAANQDAIGEATSMGIQKDMAMNYAPTGEGVRNAFATSSDRLRHYRRSAQPSSLHMPDHADDEDSQKLKTGSSAKAVK